MKAVGIICEYNPFHNGHLYHINKIREQFPNSPIILVMSGNFTERGIVSLIDKWKKTEIALAYGVDLVVELPFVFATQSADLFARGSIGILKALQVEYLVFGSENGTTEPLTHLATIQLQHPNYNPLVKKYLKEGINYPTAMSKALMALTKQTIVTPNDLLGLSYIKEIIRQHAAIKPIAIQRTNDFHAETLESSIVSATAIRKALQNGQNIQAYVPQKTNSALTNQVHFMEEYFPFLQYKISTDPKLSQYQTVDEGLDQRIRREILKHEHLDDFIKAVKTKRYTYNKIMRMLCHILCSFTKEEASKCLEPTYLRILGMNQLGRHYLKQIKKEVPLPIITACTETNHPMMDIEYRSTCAFASLLPFEEKKAIVHREYTKKPIIIEKK